MRRSASPAGGSRDPERTRLELIEAALKLMASGDSDAFSVSQAARLAGVNRGTAYFHFASRDDLVRAAIDHASARINEKLYVGPGEEASGPSFSPARIATIDEMALFLIRHPELCRVWLLEVLIKEGGFRDPWTRSVHASIEHTSASPRGRPDVDADVLSLMVFGAYFLWPLLLQERKLSPAEEVAMARRIVTEIFRMSLYGSVRPEAAPELVEIVRRRLAEDAAKPTG